VTKELESIPVQDISRLLYPLREQRVILDGDLAQLYGVTTKRLNEQYRRNVERFPQDFAFQLTAEEWASLRSQIATLETSRGSHRKYINTLLQQGDRTRWFPLIASAVSLASRHPRRIPHSVPGTP
jgi:ORF6N domain